MAMAGLGGEQSSSSMSLWIVHVWLVALNGYGPDDLVACPQTVRLGLSARPSTEPKCTPSDIGLQVIVDLDRDAVADYLAGKPRTHRDM